MNVKLDNRGAADLETKASEGTEPERTQCQPARDGMRRRLLDREAKDERACNLAVRERVAVLAERSSRDRPRPFEVGVELNLYTDRRNGAGG